MIIAVAADDVFIFYDMWLHFKEECSKTTGKQNLLVVAMSKTFKHATASILVTSFTTAAALLSNCTSNITALKAFGLFSGMFTDMHIF